MYGNAWFVDKVTYVDTANEEIDAVGKINLRHEAVADKKFKAALGDSKRQDDSTSTVKITAYEPNRLTYDVNSAAGGVVVFSEVYYPGWTAKVDGNEVEVGRVDYVLRAISVTPGHHTVELSFFPQSVKTTETIAYTGYALLLVVLAIVVFGLWKRKKANACDAKVQ